MIDTHGEFFDPTQPEKRFNGRIQYNPPGKGLLHLSVLNDDLAPAFNQSKLLWGIVKGASVTLDNTRLTELQYGNQYHGRVISFDTLIDGIHLSNLDDKQFSKVLFSTQCLYAWLGQTVYQLEKKTYDEYKIIRGKDKVLTLYKDNEFSIRAYTIPKTWFDLNFNGKHDISEASYIELVFPEDKSINEILLKVHQFCDIVSLFTHHLNIPFNVRFITIEGEDTLDVEFHDPSTESNEPESTGNPFAFWLSYAEMTEIFNDAYKLYIDKYSSLSPIMKTYTQALSSNHYSQAITLVALVQAVEAFFDSFCKEKNAHTKSNIFNFKELVLLCLDGEASEDELKIINRSWNNMCSPSLTEKFVHITNEYKDYLDTTFPGYFDHEKTFRALITNRHKCSHGKLLTIKDDLTFSKGIVYLEYLLKVLLFAEINIPHNMLKHAVKSKHYLTQNMGLLFKKKNLTTHLRGMRKRTPQFGVRRKNK